MELAIQLAAGTKIHESNKSGGIRRRLDHGDEGRVGDSGGKLCERKTYGQRTRHDLTTKNPK